jgi:hypothetical protein
MQQGSLSRQAIWWRGGGDIAFPRSTTFSQMACHLTWRWQDDVGVVFERWVDLPPRAIAFTSRAGLLQLRNCLLLALFGR